MVPVLLLITATGVIFGPWLGPLYAMAGCLASASMGFAIGRWTGLGRIERVGGTRVTRIVSSLERNGTLAVFLLRKIPAPFLLANIVAGASRVRYRDFIVGTVLGMTARGGGARGLRLSPDERRAQPVAQVRARGGSLFVGDSADARLAHQPRAAATGSAPHERPRPSPDSSGQLLASRPRAPLLRGAGRADYFRLVRQALLSARRTVFILGWDMTAGIDLDPQAPPSKVPTQFDKLLKYIVRRRPTAPLLHPDLGLRIAVHARARSVFTVAASDGACLGSVHFGFDDRHPVGASHHQKIVVIDDELAFCGGIDLTGHRWDTTAHRPDEPLRKTPMGKHVRAVSRSSGDGGRCGGRKPRRARARSLAGPRRRAPALRQHVDGGPVAGRRDSRFHRRRRGHQRGRYRDRNRSRRCASARRCSSTPSLGPRRTIYIENQYFTNYKLTDALVARLAEPHGPEVVVVVPRGQSRLARAANGRRDSRRSVPPAASHRIAHKRLRLVAPMASRARDVATFVHSKVMIADDDFVRIGSANWSHRSMGLDTECDLAVESKGDRKVQAGVRQIRDRLLAEHLGLPVEEVRTRARARRLARRASRCTPAARTTRSCASELPPEPLGPPSDAVRLAVDPDEPLGLGDSVDQLVPAVDATIGAVPLRIWVVPRRRARCSRASSRGRLVPASGRVAGTVSPPIGIGPLRRGAVSLLIPLELLAIASGVLFGARCGGTRCARRIDRPQPRSVTWPGRAIGTAGLGRWMSRRSYRSGRQLGSRGVAGVARPAPGIGGQRRRDPSSLRRVPRDVRSLSCRHRDRPRAVDRRARLARRRPSQHAPAPVAPERPLHDRRCAGRRSRRLRRANVPPDPPVRADRVAAIASGRSSADARGGADLSASRRTTCTAASGPTGATIPTGSRRSSPSSTPTSSRSRSSLIRQALRSKPARRSC